MQLEARACSPSFTTWARRRGQANGSASRSSAASVNTSGALKKAAASVRRT
jgi:hypothetical protein